MKEIVQGLLEKREALLQGQDPEDAEVDESNIVIRQYKYILERLDETGVANLDAAEDDYEEED